MQRIKQAVIGIVFGLAAILFAMLAMMGVGLNDWLYVVLTVPAVAAFAALCVYYIGRACSVST